MIPALPAARERAVLVVVAAISVLAVATDALAQTGGRGGRSRGGDSRTGAPTAKAQEPRADLLEVTLRELREDLKLTPVQQGAWDAYEGKVRALAADLKRERARRQAQAAETRTALQRIDEKVDTSRNHLAALEEIADTAQALYAVLTPEQKAIADARLAAAIPNADEPVARGAPPGAGDAGRDPPEGRPRSGAP